VAVAVDAGVGQLDPRRMNARREELIEGWIARSTSAGPLRSNKKLCWAIEKGW
jgi:hypothetical protein